LSASAWVHVVLPKDVRAGGDATATWRASSEALLQETKAAWFRNLVV